MYHLDDDRHLRVCGRYLRLEQLKKVARQTRIILLQHLLPTTQELAYLLREAGADVFSIFAKPYSIDTMVLNNLKKSKFRVEQHSYEKLETTGLLDRHLREAVDACRRDGRRIVILEVGGYFAEPLTRLQPDQVGRVAGVVEDTTFGHNRYVRLAKKIPVPVFSVARSELKEIEARFVAKDAVMAVDSVLRQLGISMFGRRALVVGYGMIGKNLARQLKEHRLVVSVYDKRHYRNFAAFCAGFEVQKRLELLKRADVVFSATGEKAIRVSDIESCKDDAVLASVGSKDTEFDIAGLKELAMDEREIGNYLKKYQLPNGRKIFVVKDGTAVNFIVRSLPKEVLDPVFAEILVCAWLLMSRVKWCKPGRVHTAPERFLNEISKNWLKYVNPLN